MNVSIVGSGGREHALAWKLKQSPLVTSIYATPGNPGIEQVADCGPDLRNADLTVIGPEVPLVEGLADKIRAQGGRVIGPSKAASQLEGSKIFSKELMIEAGIPTARYEAFEDVAPAKKALSKFSYPVVLKADGLAAGKGVVIAKSPEEAESTLEAMFAGELVGDAGKKVVIEDFCPGEEVSFIAISDGETILPLAATQDHKAIFDGDQGPNTGGMGTYCDDRILDAAAREDIMNRVMRPAIQTMAKRGTPFTGFLFAGLMMTNDGVQVLEFNVRLGDPETQSLMHRLESDLGEVLLATGERRLHEINLKWSPDPSVCVVMCAHNYPGTPRKGDVIRGIDAAEATGAVVFHAGTARAQGQIVTSGGRVLGVVAKGSDLQTAIRNSYTATDQISFDGMHFRRDIGKKGLKRW